MVVNKKNFLRVRGKYKEPKSRKKKKKKMRITVGVSTSIVIHNTRRNGVSILNS